MSSRESPYLVWAPWCAELSCSVPFAPPRSHRRRACTGERAGAGSSGKRSDPDSFELARAMLHYTRCVSG